MISIYLYLYTNNSLDNAIIYIRCGSRAEPSRVSLFLAREIGEPSRAELDSARFQPYSYYRSLYISWWTVIKRLKQAGALHDRHEALPFLNAITSHACLCKWFELFYVGVTVPRATPYYNITLD
jgi:hypothetical protein